VPARTFGISQPGSVCVRFLTRIDRQRNHPLPRFFYASTCASLASRDEAIRFFPSTGRLYTASITDLISHTAQASSRIHGSFIVAFYAARQGRHDLRFS
jgi:hypothetical protein